MGLAIESDGNDRAGCAPIRSPSPMLLGMSSATALRGIDFVLDSTGRKQAVVIDLRAHGELREDVNDQLEAEQRRDEPLIPLAEARSRLRGDIDEQ